VRCGTSSFRIIDECPCMLVGATAAAAAGAGGRRCLTVLTTLTPNFMCCERIPPGTKFVTSLAFEKLRFGYSRWYWTTVVNFTFREVWLRGWPNVDWVTIEHRQMWLLPSETTGLQLAWRLWWGTASLLRRRNATVFDLFHFSPLPLINTRCSVCSFFPNFCRKNASPQRRCVSCKDPPFQR
jgi:hypothetical protein